MIVIPPVYETVRPSTANEIVDKAIKNISKIFFIDNRNLYQDRDYYINYAPPNKKYFNKLSLEITKNFFKHNIIFIFHQIKKQFKI